MIGNSDIEIIAIFQSDRIYKFNALRMDFEIFEIYEMLLIIYEVL